MKHCEEHISRIDFYLDDELAEDDLETFHCHIKECSSCREALADRRRFLEQIRAARPLHTATPKFRAEMAAFLAAPASPAIMANDGSRAWLSWLRRKPIPALAACALAIAGVTILWRFSLSAARANTFVDMAVQTHCLQLAGHLPLEVRTNSPSEMSAWFANKVPFQFRLPMYQDTAGQEQRYELTGGRLVDFKGSHAAYVAYRMQAQVISLVVTSASSFAAAGGEKTVSKGLTFHAHRREEFQVVTWSVHNLTYALVSGVNLPAKQSCRVCHANAKDIDLIRDLKSRNRHETNRDKLDVSKQHQDSKPRIDRLLTEGNG